MSISPESSIIKRLISGISLNGISGGISNMGMSLLAKYPLLANLLDSVTGASGTLTRSTVKTFITDAGAVSSAAIDTGAFTGSGVLLEPAATNSLLHSQDYSNAAWTKVFCTISSNSLAAPDGTTTADTMVDTTTTGGYVTQSVVTGNHTGYFSVFAKKKDLNFIILIIGDNATKDAKRWFNINTGAVGSTSTAGSGASIDDSGIDALSGGWYRCWIKYTITAASTYYYVRQASTDGGFGSTIGFGTYLWQADYKSNLTSPITTTTTAITRTVDVLTVPTTGWLANDFAFYFEFTPKTADQNLITTLFRDDYGASDYVSIIHTTGSIFLTVVVGGVNRSNSFALSFVAGTKLKILVTINPTAITLNVNGTSSTTTGLNNVRHNTFASIGCFSGTPGVEVNGVISNFKPINSSNITLAQAEAL